MISIQKSGDTINFTFTDSSHYLYGNGTISVPENSLSLTIDESDIVNFKKADSNDIFISATLGEFGKTKAELIEFYKENMVNAGISPSDVETMISSATSGKVDTSAFTSYSGSIESRLSEDEEVTSAALNALNETVEGKQNTLTAGSGITISGDVISADGGGGKAIEAGRGIAITTGATADTVSFDLPISADSENNITTLNKTNTITGTSYITSNVLAGNGNTLNLNGTSYGNSYNLLFGNYNTISKSSTSNSAYNTIFGEQNTISDATKHTFICGFANTGCKSSQVIGGEGNNPLNTSEAAFGQYNNSVSGSTTFGDSGNTLFSIGNGTYNARHNAFEVRQNGDIYCSDGTNDVKLQDYIQHKIVQMTQSEYDALANKDANTIYLIIN